MLARLRSMASPGGAAGMARFGIHPRTTVLGVPMGALWRLGREIGTDHGLALQLWRSGIHEARILATIVDDPARVTVSQAERWVRRLDSWVRFRD